MRKDQGGISDSIICSRLGSDQVGRLLALMTREISPSDLTSLLLVVYNKIVGQRGVADVFQQYCHDQTLQPSEAKQGSLLLLDQQMFRVFSDDFEAVDLSPVTPLGINSILAHTSQKNVLSTVRNIEVAADVTTSLSIEAARRRKASLVESAKSQQEVRLCASQRSIRMQNFEDIPGFTNHFRVFGAVSAGRDRGHEGFETSNLSKHIGCYLDFLAWARESGFVADTIIVAISDIRIVETLLEVTGAERAVVMRTTQDPDFQLFDHCGLEAGSKVRSLNCLPQSLTGMRDLERPLSYLEQIEEKAVAELREKYGHVEFVYDLGRTSGIGYYESLCFKISAETQNGRKFPLVDGGLTDWSKKLLASRKERLFISGFGTELFCKNYRGDQAQDSRT